MFKKIAFGFALLSLCFSQGAEAAPDRIGQFDVGFYVAGKLPEDNDFDNAAYVGATASYGYTDWLAFGVETGWAEFDEDADITGVNISGGDVTAVPLLFDIILRAPNMHENIVPYGVIGFGGLFLDIDDITATAGGVSITADADIDDAFAVKLGGGIDWFINESWIFNLEFSYIFADTDVSAGGATSELELDHWTLGAGFKYLFA